MPNSTETLRVLSSPDLMGPGQSPGRGPGEEGQVFLNDLYFVFFFLTKEEINTSYFYV